MTNLRLRKADDMHIHLRQGEILEHILEQSVSQVSRAIVMPNTIPAIEDAVNLNEYRKSILVSLEQINKRKKKKNNFEPLMTFKITPKSNAEQIRALKEAGAIAGKLYPQGVTTNSENGVVDFNALYPVYEAMQENRLVLCLHGEDPKSFCIEREKAFLPTLKQIAKDFPKLKIVMEHVSTADSIKLVEQLPQNVAATITVHHLWVTLDDVIGENLRPHLFCKPLPKTPTDREALLSAALSGSPKFFLGSDSAPHLLEKKECDCGAAGVYSAPVLLPLLAQIFQQHNKLDKLQAFTSEYGAQFYGLDLNQEYIELREESWVVPDIIHGVVPFMAGLTLNWKLSE